MFDVKEQVVACMARMKEWFENESGNAKGIVLEITVEDENGTYHKHFVRLNQWVAYVVEDQGGADVGKYSYQLNFNPQMWIPADVVVSD